MEGTDPRSEHDALLAQVSTRRSTQHLFHGAISAIIAVIVLAAAGKLWRDYQQEEPLYGLVAGGLGLALLLYSLTRFLFGRSAYVRERAQFARLLELRHTLGFDDPSRLFPG